jgi:hypothetical protein
LLREETAIKAAGFLSFKPLLFGKVVGLNNIGGYQSGRGRKCQHILIARDGEVK